MDVRPAHADKSQGLQALLSQVRYAVRTRVRRAIVFTTLLLGAVSAVGVAAAAAPADRTFATISSPAQSLMSITVPFLGVLLVRDLRWPPRRSVISAVVVAEVLAIAIAVIGIAVCVLVNAIAPSAADQQHAAVIGLGSVLVQALAQLTGTGFGLLFRSAVLACLATIVIPLGLWLLFGAVQSLVPVQAWLTPYATARRLLAGDMSWTNWGQWLVVVAIWGVGLNLAGAWLGGSRRASRTYAVREVIVPSARNVDRRPQKQ
jgi:hypothetical protein